MPKMPKRLNLVLLGKAGVGKSATGNTILGRDAFISKKSFTSVTREVAEESVTIYGKHVTVFDTPGILDTVQREEEIQKYKDILQKCESGRCVFLLVIKAERVTDEDIRTMEKIEKVLGVERIQKTWILITKGDQLEKDDVTIEEFISDYEALNKLLQKYDQRYCVFNNKNSEDTGQVEMLLTKLLGRNCDTTVAISPDVVRPKMSKTPLQGIPVSSLSCIRIVLLGDGGVGKSTAGNIILGQKVFRSALRSVTNGCSYAHATVSGRSVSVVDTPEFIYINTEQLMTEIRRSVYLSRPGPHAFLIVFALNMRSSGQLMSYYIEKMLGKEALKYSIVLFTHGDQLEEETIETLIEESYIIRHLVDQCGGRFHVFNNRDVNNREQVNDLLQKIDSMIEQNGGEHYTNQMHEDALRFRQEEEEQRLIEGEERRQQKKAARRFPHLPRPKIPHTGSGDVLCDSCAGRKQKAVKSCLECRSSYCQNHLEQHQRSNRHNLMDATGRLQDMICSRHDLLLDIYCRTDQRCICVLCLLEEHMHHNIGSTETARKEKQSLLEEKQRNIQKRIRQREKDLQALREAVASHKRSAQTAVQDSERIFTELIRSIERRRSEVTQLIRDQERATVSRAELRLARLELEIDDLRRKDAELKELSHTHHHVHFLQSLSSVSLSGSTDGFTVSSRLSFDDVVKSVSQLKDKLKQFCSDETENISGTVKSVQVIQFPEYQTREEFLLYFRLLTVDLNSVHNRLRLSERNTVITYSDTRVPYPHHPDRFDCWFQAMCVEGVTGRCYWEVEWSGDGRSGPDIGVTYKSISRKGIGPESVAGRNDQSWTVDCSPNHCSSWHNNMETVLPVVSVSSRIGVYVDHSAGILSFYSVSDTMSLIHRVQTTFTQPLYAVFGFDIQTAVKLCHLTHSII